MESENVDNLQKPQEEISAQDLGFAIGEDVAQIETKPEVSPALTEEVKPAPQPAPEVMALLEKISSGQLLPN